MAMEGVQKQCNIENQDIRITGYMHNNKIDAESSRANKIAKRQSGKWVARSPLE